MTRYYEQGLPGTNYESEPLDLVALECNNHVANVYIDDSNEYGARVIFKCWSEHDDQDHWYSVRDHKGDVFVAELEITAKESPADWRPVWSSP